MIEAQAAEEARVKAEEEAKVAAVEERKRSISAKRNRTGWQPDGLHDAAWKH